MVPTAPKIHSVIFTVTAFDFWPLLERGGHLDINRHQTVNLLGTKHFADFLQSLFGSVMSSFFSNSFKNQPTNSNMSVL